MQFLPLGVVAQSTRRIQKCYVRCQVRQNKVKTLKKEKKQNAFRNTKNFNIAILENSILKAL